MLNAFPFIYLAAGCCYAPAAVRPLMIMMMERRLRGPINSFPRPAPTSFRAGCLYIPFILSAPAPGAMTCSLLTLALAVHCLNKWISTSPSWVVGGGAAESVQFRKVCVLMIIVSHSQKLISVAQSNIQALTTCHNYNRPHSLSGTHYIQLGTSQVSRGGEYRGGRPEDWH